MVSGSVHAICVGDAMAWLDGRVGPSEFTLCWALVLGLVVMRLGFVLEVSGAGLVSLLTC